MSDEQREAARIKGLQNRLGRQQARRDVRALGYVDAILAVAYLIDESPAYLGTVPVYDVIRWPKHMHWKIVLRLLNEASVSEFRIVRDLTDRQRNALVQGLRDWSVVARDNVRTAA